MRHLAKVVSGIALTILAIGCASPAEPPDDDPLGGQLQTLIESIVADNETVHSAALAVHIPSKAIEWEGAAGLADPSAGTPMTPANPARIASNTKTFVAAAVLRLVEGDRLGLDDGIAGHLPIEVVELLDSDGYDTDAITIRHLLTHTSGLFDHSETGAYTDAILADPLHHWTPLEQVSMAMEAGDPHAGPGEIYTYCDTGYVLLGLLLEKVTGQPLGAAVRELVDYDALGLASTWWEILEAPPEGVADRAHQFYGDVDSYDFFPTFDLYGGGGIVATVGDLARFFGGLFRGRVFAEPETVDTMLSTIDGIGARADASEHALPPGAYRMGVWVLETEGHTSYHHTGFFGTMAVHVPDLDLTFTATLNQNQARPAFDRLLVEVIRIVERWN
jgi:D-alanyl-D-alanine carboxypeptidase